jgi:hypothetical protein
LREEALQEQITNYLQKVSLSSQDMEKVLRELDKEEQEARDENKKIITKLEQEKQQLQVQLDKLLDVYLEEVINTQEYTTRKQKLLSKKKELDDQIQELSQSNTSWLEPAREFVISLNQAETIAKNQNPREMTTFLKKIGSNHSVQNRQWIFSAKRPYNLAAKAAEKAAQNLTFSYWCSILKISRTFFRPDFHRDG